MGNLTRLSALVCLFLIAFNGQGGLSVEKLDSQSSKLYIVYLGERQHDDVDQVVDSHHNLLTKIVGSREAAARLMVYNYKHSFSGFAAKLTKSQAQQLAELPEVIRVMPNVMYKARTTRSWDYLGLPLSGNNIPTNLLHKAKSGDGIIIGVIDSGIWPESLSFSDEGYGPIPSRWKGSCESTAPRPAVPEILRFDGKKNCNKKVIGARYYVQGFLDQLGSSANQTQYFGGEPETLSPRDMTGHGTHVASTAAGSHVRNISYVGLAGGTARGGAPRALLAIYKVFWNYQGRASSGGADVLKAMDDAVHDGVDLISASIGPTSLPEPPEFVGDSTLGIGSFHAMVKGIPTIGAGGNDGPVAESITNTEPWVINVAASTMDREFPTLITLGDNTPLQGQSLNGGNFQGTKMAGLTIGAGAGAGAGAGCETLSKANDTSSLAGTIVVCFTLAGGSQIIADLLSSLNSSGIVGLIIAKNPGDILVPVLNPTGPYVVIDLDVGSQILQYCYKTSDPKAKIGRSTTHVANTIPTKVAYFSSRGPSAFAPAILKPDITGPGSNILAAYPPFDPIATNGYYIDSGTSMATPHIAGIVALLKAVHPDWSPAAIQSALITTAHTDRNGFPIYAEGSPLKPADPFDFGGGIVNPDGASDPGLIYNAGVADYVSYFCAMGYSSPGIFNLTGKPTTCPARKPSLLDLNLPSITIPSLTNSVTILRTVTNVGPLNSVYNAVIKPPPGAKVSVSPRTLVFTSKINKISFAVTVSLDNPNPMNPGYSFGSLIWTNGIKQHAVRSHISVRAYVM